ncbi:ankyrin repeat-containing domain protein [Trichophaea hybrida]|nr:ankyrin repeat-containing domain protein [Trichophaea hybrida]
MSCSNETPLYVACRSGHFKIACKLLDKGANPSLACEFGVTPLHWLSAFSDDQIPTIARLLVDNGADLEARTTKGKAYQHDAQEMGFGMEEGTPLLWAVISHNHSAAKALVELGADPWDEVGAALPTFNSGGTEFHYSPIHFAARMHMHQMLKILLYTTEGHAILLGGNNPLNSNYRRMAAGPASTSILPLTWAATYAGEGTFCRLLLHGEKAEDACKETIHFLLAAGADPAVPVQLGKQDAFNFAIPYGQTFVLNILKEWKGGILKPNGANLSLHLRRTLFEQSPEMFDYLLGNELGISSRLTMDEWINLAKASIAICNYPHFIEGIMKSAPPGTLPSSKSLFDIATRRGNTKVAEWLLHVETKEPQQPSSLLGDLARLHNQRTANVERIWFLLSVDSDDGEESFWIPGKELGNFSVLHAAVIFSEFSRRRRRSHSCARGASREIQRESPPQLRRYPIPVDSIASRGLLWER